MARTRWFTFDLKFSVWFVNMIARGVYCTGKLAHPHEFKLKEIGGVWSQRDASCVFFCLKYQKGPSSRKVQLWKVSVHLNVLTWHQVVFLFLFDCVIWKKSRFLSEPLCSFSQLSCALKREQTIDTQTERKRRHRCADRITVCSKVLFDRTHHHGYCWDESPILRGPLEQK